MGGGAGGRRAGGGRAVRWVPAKGKNGGGVTCWLQSGRPVYESEIEIIGRRCLTGRKTGEILRPFGGKR